MMMKTLCQFLFRKSSYHGAAQPEVVLAELLRRTFSLVVRHVYVIITSISYGATKINMTRKLHKRRFSALGGRAHSIVWSPVSRKSNYIAVFVYYTSKAVT